MKNIGINWEGTVKEQWGYLNRKPSDKNTRVIKVTLSGYRTYEEAEKALLDRSKKVRVIEYELHRI